jgi:hypothetical protein
MIDYISSLNLNNPAFDIWNLRLKEVIHKWLLNSLSEAFVLVKRNGRNRGFDDEKHVSVLYQRSEKTDSDHKLNEAKLADIPLDARKKEARKPLFLTRYE